MDESIKKRILNDIQIKKFSAYGLLRNLAFFKPYLIVYLMSNGITLFQIGLLYSIREITVYIFEIPSGIIADYFGRKKEMYMCFIFYIVSFILFFFSDEFYLSAVAMVFFGLGEAFRSGTHKAMLLTYLEKNDLKKYKTFIYGRTRSFSLIGSAISSIVSILIVLFFPSSKYIFVISIVPYIIDLLLVYSYPSYLDGEINHKKVAFKSFVKGDLIKIFKNKELAKVVINQSFFTSVIKTTKDMVQPVLVSASIYIIFLSTLNEDMSSKIILGLFYFVVSIGGAFGARNSYMLNKYFSSDRFVTLSFISLSVVIMLLALSVNYSLVFVIIILFFIINVLNDVRKPIYLDLLDNVMDKSTRATVMSIEYQLGAILTIVLAPIFGYIADSKGISVAFIFIGIVTMVIAIFTKIERKC